MRATDINQLRVVPSILSADFAALADSIKQVPAADWLHVDIMDGHFVPNITIGPPVVAALRKVTNRYLDVHLMITEPERYIEAFAKAGASGITVHVEACTHLHRVLQEIHSYGIRAGVAINPATPPAILEWVLEDIDLVLVMTVNPGFGGQKFLPSMLRKVEIVRNMLSERPDCILEVDGGVDVNTAPGLVQAGARALVAGNAVFGATSPADAFDSLNNVVQRLLS